MEESALVIIDFDKAIELGFVELSDEIALQFNEGKPAQMLGADDENDE
jgi:hypothetical protein